MYLEILLVAALIVLNGALAMSELAIVSSRPARLKPLAEAGDRGAQAALKLGLDPGRFLSSVQIGITLVGVLSGAISGATLGGRLAQVLVGLGVDPDWSNSLGVVCVVVVITYFTLVVGELVPKQIALQNPERVARRAAPIMVAFARVAAPLVWVLDISGRFLLGMLGISRENAARVTEEEVRTILAEARFEGVIEDEEQEMLTSVMRLADRSARALMTPRRDVETLRLDASEAEIIDAIRRIGRPRLPIQSPDNDSVLGVLYVTDAFAALSKGQPLDLAKLMREVPVINDRTEALDVIAVLRGSPNHMALVYDEYGQFEGIITTGDILEAITGTFIEKISETPALQELAPQRYLVAGWMPADEFCEKLALPVGIAGDYETVAGLVLNLFGRLPSKSEAIAALGWNFEVVGLVDRRIDKVLVSKT